MLKPVHVGVWQWVDAGMYVMFYCLISALCGSSSRKGSGLCAAHSAG
jgi:hypothetical protein